MEYKGIPRKKRSEGKETWPGQKQVYRYYKNGIMSYDIVTLKNDVQDGDPLLKPVMKQGKRIISLPSINEIRKYVEEQIKQLPDYLKVLEKARSYPVRISDKLKECSVEIDKFLMKNDKYI